jgi:hypothetical protein
LLLFLEKEGTETELVTWVGLEWSVFVSSGVSDIVAHSVAVFVAPILVTFEQ